jgi:sugar phosphate isomerase/epimerase
MANAGKNSVGLDLSRFSGFADEAGDTIQEQIKATKELGWTRIEARNISGKNLTDIDDGVFGQVEAALKAEGVAIDCFGSAVANWAKDPRKEEDFKLSIAELERALPRMKRLGTKYIRGMSFCAVKDARPDSADIEDSVVRKLKVLAKMCQDAGVMYLHENCANFGGLSWEHSLRLAERIGSPAFKLIFDTGNPLGTYDRRGKPWQLQNSMEFYTHVKHLVERIHVKDGFFIEPTETVFNKMNYTFPGEGAGQVQEIVAAAEKSGFKGTYSMEPHMATVYHEVNGQKQALSRYDTYVEYGRRFMSLFQKASEAAR